MSTRFGAWVARARLHARLGSPIPTNTTSPSRSSRAATTVIISSGVYAGPALEPVVHSAGRSLFRLEPRRQARLLRQIPGAIRHAVHELVQIVAELDRITRDRFPRDIKIVVAVVVALRVRRVRAPRLDHHRADDHAGNHGAVGVGADHGFFHQLLYDHDDAR